MTIDKKKLQPLLWSVVASSHATDGDLQRHTQALDDFLGSLSVEQVALELLEENRQLVARARAAETQQQEVAA